MQPRRARKPEDTGMIRPSDAGRRIIVARLAGAHGVRGWVKIHSYTCPPEGVFGYHQWLVRRSDYWETAKPTDWRRHGAAFLVRLEGVTEREQARAWTGREIAIPREALPPLPAGEYYWADLVGLRVQTLDGVDLGRVDHLLETGGNDVLVVNGDRERLVPFVLGREVVTVDLDVGWIRVDWDPQF